MRIRTLIADLKTIWINKKLILEGLRYRIFKTKLSERVYEKRSAICATCPNRTMDDHKCFVPGTQPCCSLCGCSLSLKLRSLSSECPAGKWKPVMTEEQEDKYYESYGR